MIWNGIQWSKRALKQLRKLPTADAIAVYDAAGTLKAFPDCTNVKRLRDHEYGYRLELAGIVFCSTTTAA
jgi:mRNA interferase RelE/StbE